MTATELGTCSQTQTSQGGPKCGGPLEISGSQIRCLSCGAAQPQHPEQKRIDAFLAAEKAKPPARVELRPEDNEGYRSQMQTRNVEKVLQKVMADNAALAGQVAALTERVAKLEEQPKRVHRV